MPRKIKMSESPKDVMTMTNLFEKFINHCIISNFSGDTITHYCDNIHNFSLFMSIDETEADAITDEVIEEYTKYLQQKRTKKGTLLKGKTVATYLTAMRTILYWAADEGYIKKVKVVIPKTDQALKQTYTERQIKALVQKPDVKNCDFTDIRDWALVSYFLGTGQRLSTVINIKIRDVDFNEITVTLYKLKNRTQTILPLASSVITTLKEYLKYRKGKPDDYLFCNTVGEQLSTRGAQDAVAYYNRNRGVTLTSIHAFRHTFAKRSLLNGMDVMKLQQLLIHKDLNSTRVYLSMNTEDLREGLDDFNPLSRVQASAQRPEKIRMNENV